MRNKVFSLAILMVSVFSLTMSAQTKSGMDFYKGTWLAAFDGPMGTVKMEIKIGVENSKNTASINDESGKDLYKVVSIEVKEKKATIQFIGSQGSDVDLVMTIKEEDKADCLIMGTYGAEAKRKK